MMLKKLNKKKCFIKNLIKLNQIKFNCCQQFSSIKNKLAKKDELKKYSQTVLLPKTTFPSKLNIHFEQQLQNTKLFAQLYQRQEQRVNAEQFTLHDGPPYANGSVHLGHAINKILKDIICRRKVQQGYKVNYVTGWDCHGLPIELKALKDATYDGTNIYEIANKVAATAIDDQRESFKRWGIMTNWNEIYLTSQLNFIQTELNLFFNLFRKQLIYKDFLPVYWSPSNQTTLAEAELEYNERHPGYSIYVKFNLINLPQNLKKFNNLRALIWTTTPWTLIANEAIAFNKQKDYVIIKFNSVQYENEHFLVAKDLLENLKLEFNCDLIVLEHLNAKIFEQLNYSSPFRDDGATQLPFIDSDHVTMSKGTGLVHCAPNHGHDDHFAGRVHRLNVRPSVVDLNGNFKPEAGDEFVGKFVLTDGSDAVIERFSENIVLRKANFIHSYPYDWRSKQPVIILPTSQWFLNINSINQTCFRLLESIEFHPSGIKQELINQINNRPPWCLSRQRSCGVTIPAFYNPDDKDRRSPLISSKLIEHLTKLISETNNAYAWRTSTNEQLLPPEVRKSLNISGELSALRKETDILDVWFDSGLSWNILKEPKIADLYIEGMDQVRGWFQSSLLLSAALRDVAPYKRVVAHGFAVDEKFRKMSKSLGNVVDPVKLLSTGKYSADVLRWWVIRNYSNNQIAFQNFDDHSDQVQKIRSTLRFCIASIFDFDCNQEIKFNDLLIVDKFMLTKLREFTEQLEQLFNEMKIREFGKLLNEFFVEQISSFYFTRIKDNLYCNEHDSPSRKSTQFVLFKIYQVLSQCVAPILPHLAEELHQHFTNQNESSVFERPWFQCSNEWRVNNEIENAIKFAKILSSSLNKKFPAQEITNLNLYIQSSSTVREAFGPLQSVASSTNSELCHFLRISQVNFVDTFDQRMIENEQQSIAFTCEFSLDQQIQVHAIPTALQQCHRCRRFTAEQENLCDRCSSVIQATAHQI